MSKKDEGHAYWKAEVTLTKFKNEADAKANKPYDVIHDEGNLLVNVGIAILEDKLIGAGSAQVYDNGHARIGVGTGTSAATASDTDATFTSPVWQAMDSTYPSRSGTTITFQATFASGSANQAWTEWGIDNGSAATVLLNHKCPVTYGTKSSGEVWCMQVAVTIS
jgi:hypothetical protein